MYACGAHLSEILKTEISFFHPPLPLISFSRSVFYLRFASYCEYRISSVVVVIYACGANLSESLKTEVVFASDYI